jgi:hypothetical protein
MATATGTPEKPAPRGDERIYHPLEQLRGIIRTYILIEGVLSVLLFFVAWFTLALLLDYGLFKASGWDWVQDGAWGLRAAALGAALLTLLGLLAFRIVRRLTVEFSHPALALVLERRYPELLGDRLITAVELADVESQAKYGYSAEMIRQTIDEARERVGQARVREVFNWRRLWVMGGVFVAWLVGLVVLGFASHAIAAGSVQPDRAAWKSGHVVGILAERDLLLMNTPWPRRALLELLDPEKDQLLDEAGIRVATDGKAPHVRVKAYRWVIADRSRFDGWRPLMWSDVTEELVGVPVPPLPTGTKTALPDDPAKITADSIMEDESARGRLANTLGKEKYAELQAVFDALEAVAAKPSSGRTLRKLDQPEAVTLKYVGIQTAGDVELKSVGNNQYAGDVTGLKEDVLFTVRAEDFRTPERGITLVPPPSLMGLMKIEYQPAYLHYASPLVPSDPKDPGSPPVIAGYSALKGLRQRVPDERLSVTGDRTVFVVPVGSEVVITGQTERPIAEAFARPKRGRVPGGKVKIVDGKELRSDEPVPLKVGEVEETDGGKTIRRGTFTIEFKGEDRITEEVEFDFEFVNSDGVRTTRQMLIQKTDDESPVVELIPDFVRRVGKEYWVTTRARIPFNAESNMRDAAGLSKVAYNVTFQPKEAFIVRSLQFANVSRGLLAPALAGDLGQFVVSCGKYAADVKSDEANARKEASFLVGKFAALDRELQRETLTTIKSRLGTPLPANRPALVTRLGFETSLRQGVRRPDDTLDKYKWVVDGDYFDVGALKAIQAGPNDVQARYEMYLTVEATDTNFDTGPRIGQNDPIPFLVVSDGDLLVKIGEDEERLAAKLTEAIQKLDAAKSKYEFVRSKADTQLPDEIEAVKIRSRDALQDVGKARDAVQAVAREFRRLERECVYNQLADNTIAQHGKTANRLERTLDEPTKPVSQDEENTLAAGGLVPKSTFKKVDGLLGNGQNAFDQGRWPEAALVSTAAAELSNLHRELSDIRAALGEVQSKEKLRLLARQIIEQQGRIRQAVEEMKRVAEEDFFQPTPKLGTAGPFFMAKGETKKVKQTIKWRKYPEDAIVVKVTASDPSIVVPAELKLDFEKNSLDFEYEIRSGTKEGDFTVTLTPAVGDKVVVQINVK